MTRGLNPIDIRASVRTNDAGTGALEFGVSIPLISGHQSGQAMIEAEKSMSSLNPFDIRASVRTNPGRTNPRASALEMHFPRSHSHLEIVVHIQHLMHSSCEPFENHVYSRLLGEERECDAKGFPDELSGRNR